MILQEIGYFSKTHGLKGQLQLNIIKDFDIEECNALIVQLPTGQLPQFISEFRETKNGFIVSLDDITSIDEAKVYVGKKVLVDEKFIFADEDGEFVGYTLVDDTFGEVGVIDEVEDTGANLILKIDHKGKQVLLPYSEDLVMKIDEDKKIIFYKAPDGLIQMYLS